MATDNVGAPVSSCAPNSCSPRSQHFKFGAEYLYLRPSIDRTSYALSDELDVTQFLFDDLETRIQGKAITNEFRFHSGYSLFGTYFFTCSSDFTIQWNHLACNDTSSFTGAYFPTRIDPWLLKIYLTPLDTFIAPFTLGLFEGFCDSQRHFKFQNLQATLGQQVLKCRCFDLQLRGGVNFASIKIDEDIEYVTFPADAFSLVILTQQDRSHFCGVGPQLGLKMNWFLTSCFYLRGAANTSLLISKHSMRGVSHIDFISSSPTFTSFADFRDKGHHKIVPEVDLKLGLGWERCFRCFMLNLEIGFEAFNFFNAQQNFGINDDYNNSESNRLSNVGLHGLYVSGSVRF